MNPDFRGSLVKYLRSQCLLSVKAFFVLLVTLQVCLPLEAQNAAGVNEFKQAWEAARHGKRDVFEQLKSQLDDYVLYPYLQYEDYRFRRSVVDAAEMSAFLEKHDNWAFSPGLRRAWLRSLGEKKRWSDLIQYAPGEKDTDVQCYLTRARIQSNYRADLLQQAQNLWAVGKSQPDACDPVFSWLKKQNGITPELAWLRVGRAMEARQPRLTIYLARYVSTHDRVWLERWQNHDRRGYTRLDQARQWPDQEKSRQITHYGLRRLARSDPDLAWKLFGRLDGKIKWNAERRGSILNQIALWSAVADAPETIRRMHAVPESARDNQMLEWWARAGLGSQNWGEVILAVADMPDELKNSSRWRYWDARARLQMGDPEYAMSLLGKLSTEANYYGFLAADYLDGPYLICHQDPAFSEGDLENFVAKPELRRVSELQKAGMKSWSRGEWNMAMKSLGQSGLRLAAAMAIEEDWPDLAILALARSGDQNWYEWRFPITYQSAVTRHAGDKNLDVSWVYGLMRSESAMAEDAISSANARGLMQVLPGTAAQIARRHSYDYRGSEQLMQAEDNILFGTTFLRELMDRFDDNPVLVSGAYNAGPGAVKKWLSSLAGRETAVWIETLPYFETRDYIPRVLAFSTIYNWRLGQPVKRISTRMPALDSGTIAGQAGKSAIAEVACPGPSVTLLPGS